VGICGVSAIARKMEETLKRGKRQKGEASLAARNPGVKRRRRVEHPKG